MNKIVGGVVVGFIGGFVIGTYSTLDYIIRVTESCNPIDKEDSEVEDHKFKCSIFVPEIIKKIIRGKQKNDLNIKKNSEFLNGTELIIEQDRGYFSTSSTFFLEGPKRFDPQGCEMYNYEVKLVTSDPSGKETEEKMIWHRDKGPLKIYEFNPWKTSKSELQNKHIYVSVDIHNFHKTIFFNSLGSYLEKNIKKAKFASDIEILQEKKIVECEKS